VVLDSGLPILHSLPGAPTAVYIDFTGGTYGGTTYRPYDTDGDPTTFSPAEQAVITEAWRQMSSYFAIYNTDVTTQRPTVPFAWELITPSVSGGYSYVGVFPNSQPESFVNQTNAQSRVSGMAHEIGHNFGLQHQSDYDANGNKVNEYSSGFDALHGPIMGVDYARNVHKWFLGHPSNSATQLQDDMAVIASRIHRYEGTRGDGFLPHTNGGTIDTAVPLTVNGAVQSASGVIARRTDRDAYSFTSNGGPVTIDAVAPFPSALAVKLEIYQGDGTLLASQDVLPNAANNDQHITLNLPAGTWYAIVSSHGNYGDVGQYNLTAHELPPGWQTQDIGSVGKGGSAGFDYAAGAYTLAGAGADIGGTSDAFRFASQTLTGDGAISARVVSQDNTNSSAKAGVMIRGGLAANSPEVMMALTPSAGSIFEYRTSTGGNTTTTTTAGLTAPYYVYLDRTGNTLTGYDSPDGVNWTQRGSVTIALGSTVYVGLADTSKSTSTLNNSTFDTVSFAGTFGLPSGWATQDIGAVGQTGNSGTDGLSNFAVGGAGADIFDTSDAFRYTYRTLTNGGSITAYLASQDATDDWAKAGVMIRDTLAPNAKEALMAVTPGNGVTFQYRDTTGGSTVFSNTPGITAPCYVYLERIGDTLNGWYSPDGVNWTEQGSATIPMDFTVYIGLAVSSHNSSIVGNAAFAAVTPGGLIGSLTGTYNALAIPDPPALSLGTGTGVAVNWTNVTGNTGYAVERSTDGATWTQIGTTGANVTSYADNNLAGSYRYYYRVSALGSGSRSAPSGLSNIVNRPSAPPLAGVPVFSVSTSALVINWRNVSGDNGYRIERSTDGVNFTAIATVGVNVVGYYNTGLTPSTLYYYRIIALSPFGDSPPSTVTSGTTRGGLAPTPPDGKGPGDEGGGGEIAFLPPSTPISTEVVLPLGDSGRTWSVEGMSLAPVLPARQDLSGVVEGLLAASHRATRRRMDNDDLLWVEP
jgi:hypothetical protein